MTDSTLLDTGTRYADASDVERYIRNKTFDGSSDPTQTEVEDMLLEASDEVDRRTNRAWRLREMTDSEREVRFGHDVKSAQRRRRRHSSRHGFVRPLERWGAVNLKHPHVTSIDSLTVLLPRGSNDITANEGRNSDWWCNYANGTLHLDVSVFMVGPIYGAGVLNPARVRVSYKYGRDQNATGQDSTSAVSADVPDDVRRATAMLVAADLMDTDQYGSLLASGPEDVPSQSTAAQRLRDRADAALGRWRHRKVV